MLNHLPNGEVHFSFICVCLSLRAGSNRNSGLTKLDSCLLSQGCTGDSLAMDSVHVRLGTTWPGIIERLYNIRDLIFPITV